MHMYRHNLTILDNALQSQTQLTTSTCGRTKANRGICRGSLLRGILSALGWQLRVLVGRILNVIVNAEGDKARLVELVFAARVTLPAHNLLADAFLHLVDACRVAHVPAAAQRRLAPLASDGHLEEPTGRSA